MFSKNNPLVSIIIPSFNTKDYLLACLDSIFKNTKVDFEIIVVEGGSTDGSVNSLKERFSKNEKFRLINLEQNVGPAAKRNYGIKRAKGKYLVFLDSDTLVSPGWLKWPIAYLEKTPEIAGGQLKIMAMGDKERFDSVGEKISNLGFLVERARSAKDTGQFDRTEPIFSGKTAGMIFKKDVVISAGMFDPDYFIFWEEPDLCWRIWKLGYKIVFLYMGKIYHAYDLKKPSPDWQNKLTYFGCRNQLTTIIKNGVGLRGLIMLLSAIFTWTLLLFGFLIRFDFPKAKSILTAYYYLLKNFNKILIKRGKLKKLLGENFYSDKKWLNKLTVKRKISWYLGKGINYLLQKPF
ncbi:glycosyltransferase family 2 protein [Patescibacteria group bacterium]|nr:glycosyltransferase family 2 protein [Patescibacteria group bacterium]